MSVKRKHRYAAVLILTGVLSVPGVLMAAEGGGSILFHAARVFDGDEIRDGMSVLVDAGKVVRVDARAAFTDLTAGRVIDLGDATLLPGFIDLHTHVSFQNVPHDVVLRHGVTTVRDLGGPLHQPYGGDGRLRVLTSGPIITAPGGYPINVFGDDAIATAVETEEQARQAVRERVDGGAVVIKIALEPGGEAGAPWSGGHGHSHGVADAHVSHASATHARPSTHAPVAHARPHGHGSGHGAAGQVHRHDMRRAADAASGHHALASHGYAHGSDDARTAVDGWPTLSLDAVKAIVDEAHRHGLKVSAHIGDEQGAWLALQGGVDEWAHIPCARLSDGVLEHALLHRTARDQWITVITTIDTLSRCEGVSTNAYRLGALGFDLLYGAEIAHPDIPWGIDAQELMYMQQWAGMETTDVLRAATSRAGAHLGIPLLGTLQPGAPADIIAVRGNPLHALKALEYPDLVVSGGKLIVNRFD